jgi:hypothetical protein
MKQKVYDNLNNALENGYDFTNTAALVVATDLLSYADYDFQEELINEDHDLLINRIAEFVKEWQLVRRERLLRKSRQRDKNYQNKLAQHK